MESVEDGAREISIDARAKINLRLKVLARETSGYHSIETLFHRIELADRVSIRVHERSSARAIDCRGADTGPPERNLAFRAAIAFADATGWPKGFAIEIEKRIPPGGGLGGGSADAGAVLRGLDAIAPRPMGKRLLELALSLGADVPFMTLDAPYALGWGRGERLLPLPGPPPRSIGIVFPGFPVATADAYQWLAADRAADSSRAAALDLVACSNWSGLRELAVNDFDDVLCRRHPLLGEILTGLENSGAIVAMIAGSGSSAFGVFESASVAHAALAKLGANGVVTGLAT